MSTILSHHNSISQAYNNKDTLYAAIKPSLELALRKGQISPFEIALIEEWYQLTTNGRSTPIYGIIESPTQTTLTAVNQSRKSVFLRSVELRNGLVDIQEKTGMDFYLAGNPWVNGKIKFINDQ